MTPESATKKKPPFENQANQQPPGTEAKMTPEADHGEKSYRGSGRLKDKVALITGGDSGIGRAIALAYAREGADCLIAYLEEDSDAETTCDLVRDAGRKAIAVSGDIAAHRHCDDLVDRVMKEFGRIDILINNAAFQLYAESLDDVTAERWQRTWATNGDAMFYLCKAAIPHMKQGSCIINTTSIQAYDPSPYLLDYASTKSAIVGFTKALAKSVAEQGIRVNAVAPGPVWTPLIPATMPPDYVEQFGKNTLFGRPAQPAEIAPVYVWLASPEASFITAEVYGVTGGRTPV